MRIATIVLGFVFGAFLLQSAVVDFFAGMNEPPPASSFGDHAFYTVFLWLVGSSLVFGAPRVSIGCFALASVLCFVSGRNGLYAWGVASIILSGLSYMSVREKKDADEYRAILKAAAEAFLAANGQERVAPYESPVHSAPSSSARQHPASTNSEIE